MEAGQEVICLDNYCTGRKTNVAHWIGHRRFELIRPDVTEPIKLVDRMVLGLRLLGALPVQSGQDRQNHFPRDVQHAGAGPAGGLGCCCRTSEV